MYMKDRFNYMSSIMLAIGSVFCARHVHLDEAVEVREVFGE